MPAGESREPSCSIVIRAYNEEDHIGRLLTGIMRQTVRDPEVILVDSGSTDATVAIARRYPVQIVQIEPEAFTFGRSLNLGISHARSEYVVIASAHVYPIYPDWLERLLAPFADPGVALTYGKQRGSSDARFSERQILARWFPEQSDLRQSHPFCNNANAAIRRSLWAEHPYDETLTGLEDLAWSHWAMENSYQIAYVAEAEIIHVHNEAPKQVFNRFRREAMAFRRIYPAERFGLTDLFRLYATNVLSDLWHAGRQGVFRRHFTEILWFRWMQFWGTYQGFRHSGPVTWQLRRTFYYPQQLSASNLAERRGVEPIRYPDA